MFSARNFIFLLTVFSVSVVLSLSRGALPAGGLATAEMSQSAPDNSGKVCEVASPTSSFSVPYFSSAHKLNTDPRSATWAHASSAWITRDCTHQIDYPKLKTEVRAFWTDTDLYLLFICPYHELNLWLPADNSQDRLKLWDRDVVEFFLGDNWTDIKKYREFEIAPTGDWVDLDIDIGKDTYDPKWNSGWERQGRIDKQHHVWYAAARVPLRSVSEKEVVAGTKWRANLYRIDGLGEDPVRRFMCWQPTCVVNRDPNHVPENFGTLIFTK